MKCFLSRSTRSWFVFVYAVTFAALSAPAFAATVSKVSNDTFAPLRNRAAMRKVVIDTLPIYDGKRSVIELEEFNVWAPDAKVIVHGENGVVLEKLDPTPARYFRGLVNGDPESFAYFSTDPSGSNVQGVVVTKDKKFAIATQRAPAKKTATPVQGVEPIQLGAIDTFMTEFTAADGLEEESWQCAAADKHKVSKSAPIRATGADGRAIVSKGITGTQSYAIKIEILTDNELYVNLGSSTPAVTTYVTNLTGAVSTIYNRDLKINVALGNVNVYSSAADPWTAATANAGLGETGAYGHANPGASNYVFLSGKTINGGVAWVAVNGAPDYLCGSGVPGECGSGTDGFYAGPYAWCGGISASSVASTPNPDGTLGGALYGMPSGATYWPLAEYAHELGHNLGSGHTHCITVSAAETVATGRSFVDHCFNGEGAFGCYGGANTVPTEKGTIMSYCHLSFSGGFPQSRYTFGQAAELSHHVLDDFLLNPAGPNGGGTNIVTAVGAFTISAITGSSTVAASSTGNVASITATPSAGATYAWTITNGTITSSATASSITYTAGATGTVVLRATAYGTNKNGVTDTKNVVIGAGISAPTNVVATATSATTINITWTAAAGATSYHVYRTNDGTTYAQTGGNIVGLTYSDAVSSGKAYLYVVRSYNGSSESGDSNKDLAYAFIFTDPTLTTGAAGTRPKAAHITELRTAVNAVRQQLAALGAGTFTTDPTITAGVTRANRLHIIQLRVALDAARTMLGLPAASYTDTTITANVTAIKKAHIEDLRNGVK